MNDKPLFSADGDGQRQLSRPDEIIRRTVGFVTPHGINIFVALTLAFALLILLGFVLLMLPQASALGEWTNPRTALFNATSAVTDTGLVTVETGTYWSGFGQTVILILIQLGGLGFMTVTSFLLLMAGRRVLFRDFRVADALGTNNVSDFGQLIRWTLGITFVMEVAGILLLAFLLKGEGTSGHPWWTATFHAISAFNNAGFDTVGAGNSLANYASNAQVLSVVAGLSFVGALSAPVIIGLLGLMRGRQLNLDAKLALATTLGLVVIGTLLIFLMELHNPDTLGPLGTPGKLMNSFFTSVTARTTGYASVEMGALGLRVLFIIMILMFIGGVSGSTAGGIKVTTFSVLWLTALSYIRGRRHVDFARQRIPETQIHKAVAVVFFALALVLVIALILSATDDGIPFRDLSFETVSAFGTVGFSTGITSSLSAAGQFLLVFTMFVGRLGPLTVALAFAESRELKEEEHPEAEVRVG